MMKSLDPPSIVIERMIELAKDLRLAWETRERAHLPDEKADPKRDRKQAVQRERTLRKYLSQQPLAMLTVMMQVARVGTGEVQAAEAASFANPTRSERLDYLIDAIVAEMHLADYLERGLARLAEQGVDVDTLEK